MTMPDHQNTQAIFQKLLSITSSDDVASLIDGDNFFRPKTVRGNHMAVEN